MERTIGMPFGPAIQSSGRLMADNGAPWPPTLNTVRRIPPQNGIIRPAASNSSLLSAAPPAPPVPPIPPIPLSASEVIELAKEAMEIALYENETKAAEAYSVSNELKPGITIDLSHKVIQRFPEEVVDIIKHELERYCLSCPT